MNAADLLSDLLAASDNVLAAVIWAATGVPPTAADVRRWRSALRRLLYLIQRVRDSEPETMAVVPVHRDEARDLVADMLTSPEMLILLSAAAALGLGIAGLTVAVVAPARARYALLAAARGLTPDALDCAHAYAAAKALPEGASSADYWLAVRVPSSIRAALHAATPERLTWWSDRLAAARASARRTTGVLRALAADGAMAKAAHPDLDLGAVSYGPPLAIWPPPPLEDGGSAPVGGAMSSVTNCRYDAQLVPRRHRENALRPHA